MSPVSTTTATSARPPELLRTIGRWSLTALAVNCILGSGIFGLPSVVAGLVPGFSPLAVLAAGAAMAVVVACYAEVASQFAESGGNYLYARAAFGRFAGIQIAWITMLGRLAASAANANLLVIYLGEFWPRVGNPIPRLVVLTVVVGLLGAVNYRGVKGGTRISDVFVVAKLLPIGILLVAGGCWLVMHRAVSAPAAVPGEAHWLQAMLLLFFAYGGYEAALNPMGEARNPRRDVAFALFAALAIITAIYVLVQWIVVGVLRDPGQSARPLADAARIVMGRGGAALIAVGVLISCYGYLSANLLAGPRSTFALAERGDFPESFAAVHETFRTPHVSIAVFATATWILALLGSFSWNVTLSAVARLVYYGATCAALPVLRRKQPGAAWFRLPAGNWFAVLICLSLFTVVDFSRWLILAGTVGIAALNWLAVRRQTSSPPEHTGDA
jgi:basic amino acid/polyamine antiporter, APA family